MATTKRGAGTGKGAGGGYSSDGGATRGGGGRDGRPRIRSSHAGESRPPAKRAAASKRAGGPGRGGPAAAPKGAPKGAGAGPRTKKVRPTTAASAAPSLASDESREIAIAVAVAGIDKKAVGLEILDVAGKVDYADFLVLMTGRSDRQVSALAQGIEEALGKKGRKPLSVEGMQQATWILMDYGDVVVHVFQDDARSLYDIEGLWLDVRRIPIPIPEGIRGDAD
ncbi:MAG TPA: ribosome silencing factor [Polyangiaceae bacterium]